MPFQFLCPQGHLLEGVESQMGQQCQCPLCGTAFIVPVIGVAPPPAAIAPGYPPPGYPPAPAYQAPPAYNAPPAYAAPPPAAPPPMHAPAQIAPPPLPHEPPPLPAVLPDLNLSAPAGAPTADTPAVSDQPAAEAPAVEAADTKQDPNRIVRIPCPQGHELHTPMSMIGMDAMCPECGEQFNLRYEDSIEGKEEREQARQARDERINKIILRTAIGAAVVVGLAIVTMILLKIMGGGGEP